MEIAALWQASPELGKEKRKGLRFSKILTVSLNPVADLTFYVDTLDFGKENEVQEEYYDAAGKSVDVSRVLQSYGVKNCALVVAGRENSQRYFQRLAEENVEARIIHVPGRIRENITVIGRGGEMTRLLRKGSHLHGAALGEVLDALKQEVTPNSLVVVAGRLPAGMAGEQLVELCEVIRAQGGAVALDSSSVTLAEVEAIQPWVLKPNEQELEQLLSRKLTTVAERKAGVLEIQKRGVTHVLASFGPDGMLYTDGEETLQATVPELSQIQSTVGAGDAALGGFIIAQDYAFSKSESLSLAAAFGTASCLVKGTNPPRRISVAIICNQVQVFAI